MTTEKSPSRRSLIGNLAFVLSAGLLVEFARGDHAPAPWPHVVEFVATLAVIAGWGWRNHRSPQATSSTLTLRETWFACALALAPVVWEVIGRASGRFGQSPEFLLLAIVRNMAFVLAVLPRRAGPWSLSSPLALFLALGSLPSLHGVAGWTLAGLFVVTGVLRLASGGWDRLQGKFACQSTTEAPRGTILAITTACLALVLVCGAGLAGGNTTTAFFGIFPSAGGERWHDAFASGGVRDGDQLVGAQDEAHGFGPVESELFLESKQPSLYDVANDMFGPPHKTDRQERVVALSSDVKLQLDHRKKSQTQQAGREFSTVRRRGQRSPVTTTRLSDALIFVGGRTPLHLRTETFDQFDGRDWRRTDDDEPSPQLTMRRVDGKPWVEMLHGQTPWFAGPAERHLLKVIRLNSARIPTPGHAVGLHVDRVDDISFFGWTRDGALHMPGRSQIPPLQVLHLESRALDRSRVPGEFACGSPLLKNKYVAPGRQPVDDRIAALARDWTRGAPRGWPQVEAVERRLREGYVVDQETLAAADSTHSVHEFLFESRRGPDYLFASSAVLLLRSLGYPARFVLGMYAAPERYDRTSRLTPVLPQDLHAWAEVCVERNVWLTVEPTPGYEVLAPPRSWWRQAADACRAAWRSVLESPARTSATLLIVVTLFVARRTLADRALGWIWRFATWIAPAHRLSLTLWLLERRMALAGRARPASVTLARHYARWLEASTEHGHELREFLKHATRSLYSVRGSAPTEESAIRAACDAVARRWTLPRLLAASAPLSARGDSTRDPTARPFVAAATTTIPKSSHSNSSRTASPLSAGRS